MTFRFSRHGLTGRERALQRCLEIVPGATSWTILVGMLLLAFWQPIIAAILVVMLDLYWLLRLFFMTFFLVLASARLGMERKTDWMARVRGVDRLPAYLEELRYSPPAATHASRLSRWLHRSDMQALAASGRRPPASGELYHLVIIPVAKETGEILEPGIVRLTEQPFPPSRILVILAVEAWASPRVKAEAVALRQRYRRHFLDLLIVVHPEGLSGEARVKGANATYAARHAAGYFTEAGISFDRVIVSCFDADTVVSPDYLGCLTYAFLTCPVRTRASFQPIPVFHNNIWDVPGFARVLDIGSSFFQLIEATNAEKLVTFSSHSMSFKALVDVGYWPVDMISDDSAIFWKAFIHFDGDYRVVPMPVTVSMDVAMAPSWWQTVVYVYKQKRRWAWGVENFPLVMRAFLRDRKIPWLMKAGHALKLFESHVGWATWAFLLSVISWVPALLVQREFSDSVVYYTAPRLTALIFNLASIALGTTIVLSLCLLPRNPRRSTFMQRLGHAFEWLLVPLVATCLSALPALDAQTRLMFGRYMEFWVTGKGRSRVWYDRRPHEAHHRTETRRTEGARALAARGPDRTAGRKARPFSPGGGVAPRAL